MELKIAVISDLHCRHSKSDTETNTFLLTDIMRSPVKQHPAQSLISMIKNKNLSTDIVICPGDIANKTDPQGLVTGWSYLEEIKEAFGAKHIIATLGNHDVDSRKIYNSYDSFSMPTRLKENYPFPFISKKDEFFAKKFCILEFEDTLLLNFNSSHSHTNEKDCLTAIITDEILENIEEKLEYYSTKDFKYKIALTHHHPLKHANLGVTYKDSDVIEKGDALLNLVEKYNFQILIHGHKHIPRLTYYNSLPVFGSGSFSSLMNLISTGNRNMFHIVSLTPNSENGIIKTFEFINGIGWTDKFNSTSFPMVTGFGNRNSLDEIVTQIYKYFVSKNLEFMKYEDLLNPFPELKFLIPSDFEKLRNKLKTNGLLFYPEKHFIPDQLIKQKS